MNKSILACVLLGGSAALANAQAPVARYAVMDPGVARETGCDGCPDWPDSGIGTGSRLGVSGSEALGKNTSAIFAFEAGTEADTGRTEDENRLFDRQAYVGVAGPLGVLTLGRQYDFDYLALADVADPFKGDTAGSATNLVGYGDRRSDDSIQYYSAAVRGLSAGASYSRNNIDGNSASRRAWGMSVGFEHGPFTFRAAHQNLHVAKIRMYDQAGVRMDARNSIIAANWRLGWGTAYAAYSASRGWGNSPLFNPDNPYGARIASTASTNSRDVLVGVAVPVGRATTLLASFIRKNDRDLANQDARQLAVGATYAASRRLDFYAAYSHIQNVNGADYSIGKGIGSNKGTSALNVGMRHAF
ncbi:MAG TPA: porin [Telluria sp.]